MKMKLYVASFIVLALCGCQKSRDISEPAEGAVAIIGGTATDEANPQGRHVVWVADEAASLSCTGTIIARNLILTAAHCVGPSHENITLAFGVNPSLGAYQLRSSTNAIIHPQYNKSSSDDRNDLALISFAGDLPAGFTPARLPGPNFPMAASMKFTGLGYGRTSGKKSADPQDMQGSGVLRNVNLEISSLSDDQKQFKVDQSKGLGICAGDSGGPAMVSSRGTDYVIGVASAILWSVPQELSGQDKTDYIQQKDLCAEKSIYMNVIEFLPWINAASNQLLN